MRDYHGVSASRLEVLEDRLKSDVDAELTEFQGRVLLHSETPSGEVVPVWEQVDKTDVASIREVMDVASETSEDKEGVKLQFVRIPVTSESSPDVSTFSTFSYHTSAHSSSMTSLNSSTCACALTWRKQLSF